jgi:flagellar P-ring protein precursor FlgI
MKTPRRLALCIALATLAAGAAQAQAIRDLVDIQGAAPIQIEGIGIVVGLPNTGDRGTAAVERIRELCAQNNLDLDLRHLATGNSALVLVTAEIPPFSRPSRKMPVSVASLSDARDLTGGTLVRTFLLAGNGDVYARASGPVATGARTRTRGFISAGENSGATQIEVYPMGDVVSPEGHLYLNLKTPNWQDATTIAQFINQSPSLNPGADEAALFGSASFSTPVAFAKDKGQVLVRIPRAFRPREAEYINRILSLSVPVDTPPRVLINTAQGSVLTFGDIRVNGRPGVSIDNVTVTLREAVPELDLDPAYQLTPDTPRRMVELDGYGSSPDLQGLYDTLNAMGLRTEAIIQVFQNLHMIGALNAEIIHIM